MRSSTFKFIFAAIVSLSALSGCSSMLYAPTNNLYVPPEQLGLNYKQIYLTSQNKNLGGWWMTHSTKGPAKGFILFFHGNGQNRTAHYLALSWMLQEGYDYFIFDYEGYGDSDGSPSPEGTVKDGLAALDWFFKTAQAPEYHAVPLMVYAQSLGGPIALRSLIEYNTDTHASELKRLKWVVLESTFLSYEAAGANVLAAHWFTFLFQPAAYLLLSDQWSPKNKLDRLPPTHYLVMHGDHDSVIPLELGEKLFAQLPTPKEWTLIPGGSHINAFFMEDGKHRDEFLKIIQKQ